MAINLFKHQLGLRGVDPTKAVTTTSHHLLKLNGAGNLLPLASEQKAIEAYPLPPRLQALAIQQAATLKKIGALECSLHLIIALCKSLKDPESSAEEILDQFQKIPEALYFNQRESIEKNPFFLLRVRNDRGLNLIEQLHQHLSQQLNYQHAIAALIDLESFVLSSFINPSFLSDSEKVIQTAMEKFDTLSPLAKNAFYRRLDNLLGSPEASPGKNYLLHNRDLSLFVDFKDCNICKEIGDQLQSSCAIPLQPSTMYVYPEELTPSDTPEVRRIFHLFYAIKTFLNLISDSDRLQDTSFLTQKFDELDPALKEMITPLILLGSFHDPEHPIDPHAPIDFEALAHLKDVSGKPILEQIERHLIAQIEARRENLPAPRWIEYLHPRIDSHKIQIPTEASALIRFSAEMVKSAQIFHSNSMPRKTLLFDSDLPYVENELVRVAQNENLQHLCHKVAQCLPSLQDPSTLKAMEERHARGITCAQWGIFTDAALPEWTFQIVENAPSSSKERQQIERYSDILQTVIEKEALQIDLPKLCAIPLKEGRAAVMIQLEKKRVGENFKIAFNKLSVEDQKRCSRDLCRFIALTGYDRISLDTITIHGGRIQLHSLPQQFPDSIDLAKAKTELVLKNLIDQCQIERLSANEEIEKYDEGLIHLRLAAEEQLTMLKERQIETAQCIADFRSFAQVLTNPVSSPLQRRAAFEKLPLSLRNFLYHSVYAGLQRFEGIDRPLMKQIGEEKTLSSLEILTLLSSRSGINLLEQIETRYTLCEAERLLRLTRRCLINPNVPPLVLHTFVTALQQSFLGFAILSPLVEHLDRKLFALQGLSDEEAFEQVRRLLAGSDGTDGLLTTYIYILDHAKRSLSCSTMRERLRINRLFDVDVFPVKPTPKEQIQVQAKSIDLKEVAQGMRVLLISYECAQYGLKLGGLGEAVYGMGKSLKNRGCQVTLLMPKFTGLPLHIQHKIAQGHLSIIRHPIGGKVKEVRVWTLQEEGLTFAYLEDTDHLRNQFEVASGSCMYQDGNLAIADKPWHGLKERMAYFGSASGEYVVAHRDEFDAVLYNDWHGASAINQIARRYSNQWLCGQFPANVLVIHNNSYGCQGVYGVEENDILKLFGDDRPGLNVMIEALKLSDGAIAVAETFALEMQGGPIDAGIAPWVREKAHRGEFYGITNGSNPDLWNPETNLSLKEWKDPQTAEPIDLSFSSQTENLSAHKKRIREQLFKALQTYYPQALKSLNCHSAEDLINKPLILYVGRYDASQKGLDKFLPMMQAAHAKGGRVIVMGNEETNGATEILNALEERAHELKCAWITRGDQQSSSLKMQMGHEGIPGLGALIRAAADLYLVPSSFEPCGLVQTEGWLFGAPAIGTQTGGLADTIISDRSNPRFNGFTFERLYDWNSPEQDQLAAEAVSNALDFWVNLNEVEKNEMMARLMTDGRLLSWNASPVGLSPVDRYLTVLATQAIPAKQMRQLKPIDLLGLDEIPSPEKDNYFGVGLQTDLYTQFGARMVDTGVRFRVMAPAAKSIHLVIIEPNGREKSYPMQKLEDGSWLTLVANAHEGTIYQYEIENAQGRIVRKNDPFALEFEPKHKESSRVTAPPEAFEWTDQAWMQSRNERKQGPVNIYEIHTSSWFKPDNEFVSFLEIAKELGPYCKKMGFTHVELFGLCEHFTDESMGYQVSGHFAPTSRNGSLRDFQEFVDIMHTHGIALIIDFIPAHFVTNDCSLREFDGTRFFEESDLFNKDSTWGTFLFNFQRNDVRNFLLSSARFFLDECHLDGVRVDAVAHFTAFSRWKHKSLWNPGEDGTQFNRGGIQFIRDLNQLAHGRDALTLSENSWRYDLSDTTPIDDPSGIGLGFDLRFNMEARSTALQHLRASPGSRAKEANKRRYMQLMTDLPSERFIGPFMSHDEIKSCEKEKGHIAEQVRHRADTQEDVRDKVRLYYALNAFSPQHARMSVMGTEFGLSGKWDPRLPFERRQYEQDPTYQAHQQEYARINHFYLNHRAFWSAGKDLSDFAWVVLDTQEALIASRRREPSKSYLVIHNFSKKHFQKIPIRPQDEKTFCTISEARILFRSDTTDPDARGGARVLKEKNSTRHILEIDDLPQYGTVVIEELSGKEEELDEPTASTCNLS
jgi:1,4-alpha-glucan branching enzyme